MVSKVRSATETERWNGSMKHPTKNDGQPKEQPRGDEKDRSYVNFGNHLASEAAVERWLMGSPSSSSRQQQQSRFGTPTNREGNMTTTAPTNTFIYASSQTTNPSTQATTAFTTTLRTPKYNSMQGKRILRERLQSRSKLAGKNTIREHTSTTPVTVTPPPPPAHSGIRVRMANPSVGGNNSAIDRFSSSGTSNNVHNQSCLVEEAFQNRMLLTVVSSESSNGHAKHTRRSCLQTDLTVNTSPLGTLPEEELSATNPFYYCGDDDEDDGDYSSPTSSPPQIPAGGRNSSRRLRPSQDKRTLCGATNTKAFFPPSPSSGSRRNFTKGIGGDETEQSRSGETKKKIITPPSFRRGRSSLSVESEQTYESSSKRSNLQERRLSTSRGSNSRRRGGGEGNNSSSDIVPLPLGAQESTSCGIVSNKYNASRLFSSFPEAQIAKEAREQQEQQQNIKKKKAQSLPPQRKKIGPVVMNRIKLNIYDLLANEVVMQLPFGIHFPIGQCFGALNSGLHTLGTGAYHVGIEINGIEYAYGANSTKGVTGIFACVPRHSPGYQYRTAIDFGERGLIRDIQLIKENGIDEPRQRHVDGREVIREMTEDYVGIDYDLLRKNCCTFAHDACRRLGVNEEEIPSWFRNLGDAGALTQDAANLTMEPIQQVFSACGDIDMDRAFDAGAVEDHVDWLLPTNLVNDKEYDDDDYN